jgi:HlyD family secretion protein
MVLKTRASAWWAAGLAASGVLAYFAYGQLLGSQITLEPVLQGTLVHTIVASGRVETAHRINLGSQITGTVRSVLVTDGQPVKRGQLLLEMDGSELQANLAQATAAEQLALSNLRLLSELKQPLADQAVAQAQLNLRSAQRTAARAQELYAQGFYGAAATEEAQRALDLAQTQVTIAKHQWSSLQSPGAETASAKASLRQAQAASQTAQARLRYSRITAPVDGVVMARNVEAGDGVQPGKVLMVLSPEGNIQLVLQIDEKNLKWLHTGQNAWASADAFSEQKFAARVVFINPAVDPQRGAIEVRLDVSEPVAQLRQDMTVSVDIEVARRPQALHIPLTAIHDVNQAAPWVLLWRDGRAQRQVVMPGLQAQGRVEILSGLKTGALLVPVAQSTVREGDRIRQALP